MVMIVGGGMVKESWAVVWLAVVERRCADVQCVVWQSLWRGRCQKGRFGLSVVSENTCLRVPRLSPRPPTPSASSEYTSHHKRNTITDHYQMNDETAEEMKYRPEIEMIRGVEKASQLTFDACKNDNEI